MIPSQRLSDKCFEALVVISQAFIAVVAGGGGRFRFVVVTHRPRRRRVNHMPKNEAAIAEINALEDRRYRAMLAGDVAVLDELCSDDLIYTHSKADYDDKRRYLHKVGTRYFTYLEITHPADRILVVDGAALVTGRMTAKVSVAGTIVHVDNRYLAVRVRERRAWKFVAYQPTPIIHR